MPTSGSPTSVPSSAPVTSRPTRPGETNRPTSTPSTSQPTSIPTSRPTSRPTVAPSPVPSSNPTNPTSSPTVFVPLLFGLTYPVAISVILVGGILIFCSIGGYFLLLNRQKNTKIVVDISNYGNDDFETEFVPQVNHRFTMLFYCKSPMTFFY
jgi:hypothetical protein